MTDYQLHHGDCLDVLPELADGSVDAVICDPPYGIGYASSKTTHINGNPRCNRSSFGDDTYSSNWMYAIEQTMKIDSFAYVFVRWDTAHLFKRDAEASGLICVQRLIWDKLHWGMGDLRYYGSQTEDCLLFRKGSPSLHLDQRKGNIWSYPSKAYFPEGVFDHPTQKPLGVIRAWIEDATRPGDTILDPFMGSGTTGVAAMLTGRKFIGIEIDAHYHAIAERRIADAARQARGEFRQIHSNGVVCDDLPLFEGVSAQ